VLIFGVALGIGVAVENVHSTQIGTVGACVPATKADLLNGAACTKEEAKSPALLAGLQVGDKVTSFDGVAVSTYTQLKAEILKVKPGTEVTVTVNRNGHALTVHTKLAGVPGYGSYFGIAPTYVYQRQSPLAAIGNVGTGFSQVITGSVSALKQLPGAVPDLFKPNRSQTAAGNVSSVVGAARETGQAVASDASWQAKVEFVLLLVASLNIFVGVFNLLPLLPMDGGHIAVVLWEWIRSSFARLRRRPDPGLVDYRKLIPVSFSVFMVLVVFGAMLILADIVNPVNVG
jgi:membrane-associated protease RseP (regulator of RpoE activity)